MSNSSNRTPYVRLSPRHCAAAVEFKIRQVAPFVPAARDRGPVRVRNILKLYSMTYVEYETSAPQMDDVVV